MSVAGALRAPRSRSRAGARSADFALAKTCAAAALAGYVLSSLWAANLAERDEYEARRLAANARNVRAAAALERERSDARLALRAVEAWAARNGFFDGREPAKGEKGG
jgi:hypothetical protein